jgi:hypothetical protein
MATSFGDDFGDPSRYMGKSPLASIGEALKTGAVVYGLEKSGLRQYLDDLGIKQDKSGKFGITGAAPPPSQSAVPVSPAAISIPLGQPQNTLTPPASKSIGLDVLDDKFYGAPTSFVNPMNINDFNPVPLQSGYTPQLAGDFDFQNLPGYGSAVNKLKMFAGMF